LRIINYSSDMTTSFGARPCVHLTLSSDDANRSEMFLHTSRYVECYRLYRYMYAAYVRMISWKTQLTVDQSAYFESHLRNICSLLKIGKLENLIQYIYNSTKERFFFEDAKINVSCQYFSWQETFIFASSKKKRSFVEL